MTTAAIIIIGNEILSGKFVDENSPWLIRACTSRGVRVQSVRIIPDDIETIARVVKSDAAAFDLVFTTGGVGPTHDDCTIAAVARAFDVGLYRHPQLVERLKSWFGDSIEAAALRMADIPENAELIPTSPQMAPQLKVENVYVFPGVPRLLQKKFSAIMHLFHGPERYSKRVPLNSRESTIAEQLEEIQLQHPDVSIGSYPRFGETPSLILTVDGLDETKVDEVAAGLRVEFESWLHSGSG